MAIPKRVSQRLDAAARKFQPILQEARTRDVNEADTVTIVKGLLAEMLGWDPFFEVTSEYAIRGTYVDLAVTREDEIMFLIEVKAIGSDLRENHLRQVVNYAANQGVDWVVLTNGAIWQAHRVTFGKPIGNELVFELDLLGDDVRSEPFVECAFLLSSEGMKKSAIAQYHAEKQAMSKFNVAAILREEPVLREVSKELRRAFPSLRPTNEQILAIIENDVLKREVVEGERAAEALKAMRKASRPLRKRSSKSKSEPDSADVPSIEPSTRPDTAPAIAGGAD